VTGNCVYTLVLETAVVSVFCSWY